MAYNNNSQRSGGRIRYDIIERIGVLGERRDGWTREVNIVAWNGAQAKVDIRDWDPEHKRMSKGITLLEDEAENLVRALSVRYGFRIGNNTMASTVYERREAAPRPNPESDFRPYGESEQREFSADSRSMPQEGSVQRDESTWEGSTNGNTDTGFDTSNYGANGSGLYDNMENEPIRSAEVAEDSRSDDADDDDYD